MKVVFAVSLVIMSRLEFKAVTKVYQESSIKYRIVKLEVGKMMRVKELINKKETKMNRKKKGQVFVILITRSSRTKKWIVLLIINRESLKVKKSFWSQIALLMTIVNHVSLFLSNQRDYSWKNVKYFIHKFNG